MRSSARNRVDGCPMRRRSRLATGNGWRWTSTFPFDNSGTKKEASAGPTRIRRDSPRTSVFGQEGYLIHCELREEANTARRERRTFWTSHRYARRITPAKLLVRMDAGNDDVENIRRCKKHENVDLPHQAEPRRNRWKSGWRRRKRMATGSFRATARRSIRAKRGGCWTARSVAWCSR